MKTINQLFKYSRPVIRPLVYAHDGIAGDVPLLWDAYKKGLFPDLPEDYEISEFYALTESMGEEIFETWIVEDKVRGEVVPVGVVFCKCDGWQFEPHVTYFDNATVKIKLRTYAAFLKKTKYRKDIGACVARVPKNTIKLANAIEKMGLLKYVGKIWGGRPDGNDYIYSIRCSRRT
jgi:hypothetical protein